MDASNNFDIAFKKLQQEMHAHAQLLEKDKTELKRLIDENATSKTDIIKMKEEIINKEKKMKENETKKSQLEREINTMQREQVKEHMELQKVEAENRARLTQHGAKIPEKPNF